MDTHINSLKTIKCRSIILNDDKILVVKHGLHADYYALPGGHIEVEENPKECIEREIFEEFGIKPEVGQLLYINQYTGYYGENFMEFFFEIKNCQDYLDIDKLKGSHSHELIDILWVSKEEDIKILPKKLNEDFKNGILGKIELQFIR